MNDRGAAEAGRRPPGSRGAPRARRAIGGPLFATACLVLFIVLWGGVVIGKRVMVAGDALYLVGPWSGTPGSHSIHNPLLGDGVDQFLPWLILIRQAFLAGRLPLWNPYALFGTPLLANGQAAPFSPFSLFAVVIGGARGMSLAMLAKLWVAGVGMYVFLRRVRVGPVGAVLGGLSFSTSSFMIVWLHGQGSAVAALLPWVFAAAEWYIQEPRIRRLAVLALTVGLQFLAGQPDASLYLCFGVAIYGLVRCAPSSHRAALPGLVAAGVLGVLIASIQLVPFAVVLRQSGAIGGRASANVGLERLPVTYLTNWLVPNLHGNPAIDGAMRSPNYLSTGFAGVTALTLAVPGLFFQWRRDRAITVALVVIGLVSVATVYGILTPVLGRLPGFASAPSPRMLMLSCFVVAGLGGIGLDGLAHSPAAVGLKPGGLVASLVGFAALGAVVAGAVVFRVRGAGVDSLAPDLHPGWVTFWLVFGAACLLGAVSLAIAARFGAPRAGVTGLAVLALVEAAVFAGPFQPQLRPSEVPPHSAAMDWLVAHAGSRTIAAQGLDIQPEVASLYGLHDARGYEHDESPRVAIFWSHADPGFTQSETFTATVLSQPGERWLAAAGVSFFMTTGSTSLPGTVPVYRADGVTISRVPDARPFAFAAPSVRWVGSAQQAAAGMTADPLAPVYLEGSGPESSGRATVRVMSRRPGRVELEVQAAQPAEVVVLQSYAPGWSATVDGGHAAISPADVLFQAVHVPAGTDRVVLVYRPTSVPVGIGLTVGSLFLVVLFFVFDPRLVRLRRSRRGLGSRPRSTPVIPSS